MPFIASAPGVLVPGQTGSGRPGDVCPQGWDEDFDRSAMSTQVLINRQAPSNLPVLRYNFPGSVPPAVGELSLNGAQSEATLMYVSHRTADGYEAVIDLRYLTTNSTVRLADADNTSVALGYRVTGAPTENANGFTIPIVWQDGQTPVPAGVAALTMQLLPEPPDLYIDTMGKNFYGVETFSRTDLINTSRALFATLADRILEIRGVNSVPRVDAVTIDARTGKFILQNMEMMSSCRPDKPSRYRLRLQVNERPIFDRMCFATSVRHFISRDEWTLRISFDVAEWAAQL